MSLINTTILPFTAQAYKDGKFVAKWAIPAGAWDPGPFVEPFLAVDDAGNVYSTAPTSKTVIKFSPTGEVLGQKNSDGKNTLQLPTGIWVDPDGTVYRYTDPDAWAVTEKCKRAVDVLNERYG